MPGARRGGRICLGALMGVGLLVLASGAGLAEEAGDRGVGQVKTVEGSAHAWRADRRVALTPGDAVFTADTLVTGAASALGVTLEDGTMLSLGAEGELVIDDFVYDPAGDDHGLQLSFLAGGLGYVSGRIARLAPDSVKVTTPVATIGIRGTRFLMRLPADVKGGRSHD